MPNIIVIPNGDGCWPDLLAIDPEKKIVAAGQDAPEIQLAVLKGGMESGAESVGIRFDLPDGRTVMIETSLHALLFAAHLLAATYPVTNGQAEQRFREVMDGLTSNPPTPNEKGGVDINITGEKPDLRYRN